MSQMAAAIQQLEDADRYAKLYADTRQAFIENFMTPAGNLSGQTQTAYVLALHFGLVPEELGARVFAKLLKDIESTRDMHISTGFVGTPYICQVLSDYGRVDTAYALLLQETWPSWLYSVVHGATTIWERWDGWTEENGFQDPSMNSFNHYAYGAIGTWMVENILGIRTDPGKPGFQRILLHPRPGGGLTYAHGAYQSPYGQIESDWELAGDSFSWKLTVPPNTSALATLPAKPEDTIFEGGLPVTESPGIEAVDHGADFQAFKLPAGQYHFEVRF
jgi:alpha-L-rhamnosidase